MDALLVEFKAFVEADPAAAPQDAIRKLWLESAMGRADRYLNNPFLAADKLTEAPIPAAVKLAVFELAKHGPKPGSDPRVASEVAGKVQRSYFAIDRTVETTIQQLLAPFRLVPGF